jgi:tRNA-2-methylthio-N6-dimethylallyladenosine synthase
VLAELKLDKVHLARYSPRPGTVSARTLADDAPEEEKRRRFQVIETLQKEIGEAKMARYLGRVETVLVEEQRQRRWYGRNPQGKLVFFDDPRALRGQVVRVRISHTGPWSMSGTAVDKPRVQPADFTESIVISMLL